MTRDEIRERLTELHAPTTQAKGLATGYDAIADTLVLDDVHVLLSLIAQRDSLADDAEVLLWCYAEREPERVGDVLVHRLREAPTPAIVLALGATGRTDLLDDVAALGPPSVSDEMAVALISTVVGLGGIEVLAEWAAMDTLPASLRAEIGSLLGDG